jgi:hypothetical protein
VGAANLTAVQAGNGFVWPQSLSTNDDQDFGAIDLSFTQRLWSVLDGRPYLFDSLAKPADRIRRSRFLSPVDQI